MKIKVTKNNIAAGCRSHSSNCPLARAISRYFPETIVRVGLTHAFVYNKPDGTSTDYPLPPEASNFVRRFDKGLVVTPFTFEL